MLYTIAIISGIVAGILFSLFRHGFKIATIIYVVLMLVFLSMSQTAPVEGFAQLGYFIMFLIVGISFVVFIITHLIVRYGFKKNPQ